MLGKLCCMIHQAQHWLPNHQRCPLWISSAILSRLQPYRACVFLYEVLSPPSWRVCSSGHDNNDARRSLPLPSQSSVFDKHGWYPWLVQVLWLYLVHNVVLSTFIECKTAGCCYCCYWVNPMFHCRVEKLAMHRSLYLSRPHAFYGSQLFPTRVGPFSLLCDLGSSVPLHSSLLATSLSLYTCYPYSILGMGAVCSRSRVFCLFFLPCHSCPLSRKSHCFWIRLTYLVSTLSFVLTGLIPLPQLRTPPLPCHMWSDAIPSSFHQKMQHNLVAACLELSCPCFTACWKSAADYDQR